VSEKLIARLVVELTLKKAFADDVRLAVARRGHDRLVDDHTFKEALENVHEANG
jgi:hypothetical protein